MVKDMTTTTGFAKKRPKHWGKAVSSIAVTLVAMPLTHLLVRLLRDASWGISLRHGFATVIIFGYPSKCSTAFSYFLPCGMPPANTLYK